MAPAASPFGPDTQKYWDRRYLVFTKFDQGIVVDREGLFSAKPESIATEIAQTLPGNAVLDAFCGVGGSAIAFARTGKKVFAVDIDKSRLSMARHNAEIYDCADNITFIEGDIWGYWDTLLTIVDSIYLDPAWGGPDYYKAHRFLLPMFAPDGNVLLSAAIETTLPFAFTVPRNFDLNEFGMRHVSFRVAWHQVASIEFLTAYFRS